VTLAVPALGWVPATERGVPATDRVDAWLLPCDANRRERVRAVLAGCLGIAPETLVLRAGIHGKPELVGAPFDLRFNVAHSGDRMLLAVRLGHEVGVDLERIRPDVDADAVVATVFPASWRVAWRSMPAAGKREAFFDAWARFEALAKAGGRGIAASDPLAGSERFHARALPEIPGCAAAVASEGRNWALACWVSGS
jgi:phosphopantetheinyl transferase